MTWHYAFVQDEEFGSFDVYEIVTTTMGGYLRTENPVFNLPGWNVDEAIRGLELMIRDLKKNRVHESVEKLDSYYEIKE